jgi:alkylated DNA repair dioxygenase AlkB
MNIKRKKGLETDDKIAKKIKQNFTKNELDLIRIVPNCEEKVVYLNEDKSSWIKFKKIGKDDQLGLTMNEFEQLWKQKPDKKLQIKIAGKLIDCPRYSKSYLQPYKFSGLNHEADLDIPERIGQLLVYCQQNLNSNLNQCLVNWYESDGSIGKHSDDTKQLKPDSEIFSFSFGPATRTFILEPKKKDVNKKIYHIQLEHNTFVIMGGKCQQTHYHSVPKCNNDFNRRLNVTFRCFK